MSLTSAIQGLESLIGKTVGSGECYGIPAYLSLHAGGVKIGGGFEMDTSKLIGVGYNAFQIGTDWDWQSVGWQVLDGSNELKVGDIVTYKDSTNVWFLTNVGHVEVVRSVNDFNNYTTYAQNVGYKRYLTIENRNRSHQPIYQIIRSPESIEKNVVGDGNVDSEADVDTGTNTGNVNKKVVTNKDSLGIIRLNSFDYKPKHLEFELNFHRVMYNLLNNEFKKQVKEDILETQLLHSEFTNIKLIDFFGNFYNYGLENLKQLETHTIKIIGSGGISNAVNYSLENYNVYGDTDEKSILNYNGIVNGVIDRSSRALPIVNDRTADYMQGNKFQLDAQQQSFNSQRELTEKQALLNIESVNNANLQASYSSQYAIDLEDLTNDNSTARKIMKGIQMLGNLEFGNLIDYGFNHHLHMAQRDMNVANLKTMQNFSENENNLRSQNAVLSNLQAKTNLENSINMFNAKMKDLKNSPNIIQTQGSSDLYFQNGNALDDIFLIWCVPNIDILIQLNRHLYLYGINYNKYMYNIKKCFDTRILFNYIKTTNINFYGIEINIHHLNSLKAIFNSGVRVWNYENMNRDNSLKNLFNYNLLNGDKT